MFPSTQGGWLEKNYQDWLLGGANLSIKSCVKPASNGPDEVITILTAISAHLPRHQVYRKCGCCGGVRGLKLKRHIVPPIQPRKCWQVCTVFKLYMMPQIVIYTKFISPGDGAFFASFATPTMMLFLLISPHLPHSSRPCWLRARSQIICCLLSVVMLILRYLRNEWSFREVPK